MPGFSAPSPPEQLHSVNFTLSTPPGPTLTIANIDNFQFLLRARLSPTIFTIRIIVRDNSP
ncbi:hypothetical protein ED733_003249 [Metarhizium rileyi]|uniref:Uncharacterized protein n=1 Tax=Metarhizium rileyi (strain RCEF 4871) TaxID=1649241 RepID=A0A5C6G2X0_METRR|nr:hypothetical protein ED733_003249 [Metarhizium rileyi]